MKHNNPTISENQRRALNLKSGDFASNEVGEVIMQTIPITSIVNVVADRNSTTTGTGTIYLTPSDKDFYLTAIHFNVVQNAACDSDNSFLTISVNGTIRYIVLGTNAGVVNNVVADIPFNPPVKLDRGFSMQLAGNFTAGLHRKTATIFGYTEEVII